MKKNIFFLSLSLLLCSACSVLHISPSKKITTLSFEQAARNEAYYFIYPDAKTDTNLIRLRKQYQLEEVVKNAKNEQEKVLMMLDWVRHRWEHNGWHNAKTNNACTILERAEKGEHFRCVEYGVVLKNCLLSVGLPARQLGLMTRDVEVTKFGAGHVLSEVWLADKQKWAMVDAQFNTMPMIDDLPLNAVELQKAIIEKKNYRFVNIKGEVSKKERKDYMGFIPHYLYYFNTNLDHRTLPRKERLTINGNDGIGIKPIGAKTPTVFQRKYPIEGDYYSSSLTDFYAPPTKDLVWTKLTTEPYKGKQDDITFVDEKTGWYVNGYGKIFHTEDGGNTWQMQLEKKGTFFRCIAFLDKNIGFAGTVGTDYFPNVTDTIPLYGTKDGGKTWSPVAYKGNYVKGLCAIDIVKEQYINHGDIAYKYHLFGVGRVGSPANSLISHDGGETWTSQSMNNDCKMLFDIKMFDKKEGIACAATDEDIEKSNALILKTTDGGETWQKVYQSNRLFEGTWKASFPSRNIGYVTIQSYNPDTLVKQQRIAKTTDGGNTWQEINLTEDNAAREFGIGFVDENHGYVGTMSSGFETKNGGVTWQKIDLGKACNKIRIYKNAKGKPYGYSIGVSVFKME